MGNLYWSIVVLVVGGCVGSFLNVVIYRWPRELSIRRPLRSFCPTCEGSIAWYDNVPVVSYLLLRGRCRRCRAAISLQYPLVELATAMVFLLTYDAFFVARQRIGIGNELLVDWPMLIGHWVLWAGLIALAVMDLEAYLVDIRLTWAAAAAGLIAHTLWTPASSAGWIRPSPAQAAFAVAAGVGLAVGGLTFLRRGCEPWGEEGPPVEEPPAEEVPTGHPQASSALRWAWLIAAVVLVAAYVIVMITAGEQAPVSSTPPRTYGRLGPAPPSPGALDAGAIRLGIGLAVVFVGLVLVASHPRPEADSGIVEAIREEAPASRGNALWELKLLTPAILLGSGVIVVLMQDPAALERVRRWVHWNPAGHWQPVWGLATAVTGWVIGGAIGWLARIGFTLLFGKEALGMGDVHILAAAGAVAGWPIALAGFFLAAPLALLGVVVIRLRRQSRALPYGPWLALAFLLASMFQDRILLYADLRWLLETA